MRISLVIIVSVSILTACGTGSGSRSEEEGGTGRESHASPVSALFQQEDRDILDQFLKELAPHAGEPINLLLVRVGKLFLDTPYVAHTLERDTEVLVVNLRELDCTTYAENCLAISRTVQSEEPSFERFLEELRLIRYRDGQMDGYPSRLHYFCDWIHNNAQKGLLRECAGEMGGIPLSKEINFMSTHPEDYQQLASDPALVEIIRAQEGKINEREIRYIPEARLDEVEDQLQDGDIVGITTDVDGIAVMHVGIVVRIDHTLHLMHASSAAGKVVVSGGTLEDYLIQSNRATGILVARPI